MSEIFNKIKISIEGLSGQEVLDSWREITGYSKEDYPFMVRKKSITLPDGGGISQYYDIMSVWSIEKPEFKICVKADCYSPHSGKWNEVWENGKLIRNGEEIKYEREIDPFSHPYLFNPSRRYKEETRILK